jgi:hypothetical protein
MRACLSPLVTLFERHGKIEVRVRKGGVALERRTKGENRLVHLIAFEVQEPEVVKGLRLFRVAFERASVVALGDVESISPVLEVAEVRQRVGERGIERQRFLIGLLGLLVRLLVLVEAAALR